MSSNVEKGEENKVAKRNRIRPDLIACKQYAFDRKIHENYTMGNEYECEIIEQKT